jgi:hypothetical protein
METLTYSMKRWTTDQLIGEVVRRTATDGSALRLVEGVIIRARLAVGDRLRAASESLPGLGPSEASAEVRGTTEMGLADESGRAGS